jgi:single-strand DNA-binding protein
MSYNLVILMGNITKDPEVKYLPDGTAVCEIGIAVNKKFKNKAGEEKEKVTFAGVVFWGKQAENVAKFFSKGKPIFIEGELEQDTWTDTDGKKQTKTKIRGNQWQFCGGDRGQREESPAPRPERPAQGVATETPDDDDIPF